jgi:hypothetical protein
MDVAAGAIRSVSGTPTERGLRRVPMWIWGLVIGYLSVLCGAAVWAFVERKRAAIVKRARWATREQTSRLSDAEVSLPG